MAKTKKNVVQIAQELAQEPLSTLGLTLWDVRFEKEGADWYLRYFIDKPGGVDIQDCTDFSRAVDGLLDEADPIDQSYMLEVSSPGIERRLTRDRHYQAYIGHKIVVRLIRPIDGKRELIGELVSKEGDRICILLDGETNMELMKQDTAYVRLYADFTARED